MICFYCAEQIQDEAIKCRYCGERLTKPNRAGYPSFYTNTASTGLDPYFTVWDYAILVNEDEDGGWLMQDDHIGSLHAIGNDPDEKRLVHNIWMKMRERAEELDDRPPTQERAFLSVMIRYIMSLNPFIGSSSTVWSKANIEAVKRNLGKYEQEAKEGLIGECRDSTVAMIRKSLASLEAY